MPIWALSKRACQTVTASKDCEAIPHWFSNFIASCNDDGKARRSVLHACITSSPPTPTLLPASYCKARQEGSLQCPVPHVERGGEAVYSESEDGIFANGPPGPLCPHVSSMQGCFSPDSCQRSTATVPQKHSQSPIMGFLQYSSEAFAGPQLAQVVGEGYGFAAHVIPS